MEVAEDGSVVVRVTSPPEKGKANEACLELLARALNVPRQDVQLARGHHSRDKVFVVDGLEEGEVRARLNALR